MTGAPAHVDARLPRTAFGARVTQARPPAVRGRFMQAADVAGDLLGIVGFVFCIPFVILAIGTPIVLSVAFLAWLVGLR